MSDIYKPALAQVPACAGLCHGGRVECPHAGECQTRADRWALLTLVALCVVSWGVVGFGAYVILDWLK